MPPSQVRPTEPRERLAAVKQGVGTGKWGFGTGKWGFDADRSGIGGRQARAWSMRRWSFRTSRSLAACTRAMRCDAGC
eukprot:2773669-Rhodomonas_salina.3